MIQSPIAAFVTTTVFVVASISAGQADAQNGRRGQCSGRTQGPSLTSTASASPFIQSPLVTNGFPQASSMSSRFPQQSTQFRSQVASVLSQNAQRQRLASARRSSQTFTDRLARADAKRAARAQRAAERLRMRSQSESAIMLASTNARR